MNCEGETRSVRWWAVWWLRTTHLFVGGLLMAALAAAMLIETRYPTLIRYADFILMPPLLWSLWANWPGNFTSDSLGRDAPPGAMGIFIWIPCFYLLYWQRGHAWAVIAFGLMSAVVFAIMAKSRREYFVIAAIGWSLASVSVFLLHWPNSHRFLLVFVLGGLVTALQGGIAFARALLALRTSRFQRAAG